MKRIIVIGSAGSGKSTLSQKLGAILNLPVVHLDKFYWKPNWEATPNEEWDERVKKLTEADQWIIDGNYSRTMDIRIERADLIIYLDMPTLLCLYRVLKRRVIYHNRTRPDLHEGCPEQLDLAFIKWVWNYRKRSRPQTLYRLEQAKHHKQVIVVTSRKQVDELIDQFR